MAMVVLFFADIKNNVWVRIIEPSSDDDDENYQKTDHNVLSKSITILGNITWYISRIFFQKKIQDVSDLYTIFMGCHLNYI